MSERIGFRTAGYRNRPIEEAIRSIAEIGYDGIELCLEHPDLTPESLTDDRCRELVDIAGELGLEIATISYHGDRDPLDLRWTRALAAVALTPALESDTVIVNSPRPGNGAPADLDEQFRYNLSAQLELASLLGVQVALEPEPGLLIDCCAGMTRLIDEMDSPWLKANLDVGHAWLTEDDVPAAIAMLGPHIAAVHVEDMAGKVHRHLVPGTAEMDLPQIRDALRAQGFNGWMTVDLFDIADDPDSAARASLAYMQQLLA